MKTSVPPSPPRERVSERRQAAPAPTLTTELPERLPPRPGPVPGARAGQRLHRRPMACAGRGARGLRRRSPTRSAQAVPRIAAGGRLVYVGAGTSGRLGRARQRRALPDLLVAARRAPWRCSPAASRRCSKRSKAPRTAWSRAASTSRRSSCSAERRRDPARRLGRDAVRDGRAGGGACRRCADDRHRQQPGGAGHAGRRHRDHAEHRQRGHLRQHAAEGRHLAEDRAQHAVAARSWCG